MDSQQLQVVQDQSFNVMKFTLPELIDSLEIDGLLDQALRSLDGRANQGWIIDLSATAYLGSSMLGLMVNIRERIKQAGGKLVLCGLSPELLRIFQACCLERLFTIVKTRPEALAAAARS